MSTARQRRALRGIVTASLATFLALISHTLGGGDMPGWLGIAVPWLLALPAAVALSGRRLSLWRLSASVAVSQVLFHVLFVLGAPATGAIGIAPHAGHGSHGAELILHASPSVAHALHAGPEMWAWHGVAAVLTVALLYRAERAALRLREIAGQLAAWVRRRVARAAGALAPRPAPRRIPAGWAARTFSSRPELAPLMRRGPPPLHAL